MITTASLVLSMTIWKNFGEAVKFLSFRVSSINI
jgi:hypothetical protein